METFNEERNGENMNGKSILYGFITGSVLGGAITLLSTPKPGNEVQKLIASNINDLMSSLANVKEKTILLKSQVETVTKESFSTIKSVSTDVKSSITEWKKDVEPTVNDIQRSIQELHETIDKLEKEIKRPLS